MKESYEECEANNFGLQRRCDSGNNVVLSVRAEVHAGRLLSSEISLSVCRPCLDKGKATPTRPLWQGRVGHGGVVEPEHVCNISNARTGRSHWPLDINTSFILCRWTRAVSEPLRGQG